MNNKQKKLNKTQIEILDLINKNSSITQKEMSKIIGLAMPTIQKNITLLKNENIISRQGATKKRKMDYK